MLFSSIVFLFTFLPAVLVLYYLLPERFHNPVLLLASLIFYAWGEPVYIFLMLLSILFNYFSGLDIARNLTDRRLAKRSLIFNIVVNIAILGFFKYEGFVLDSLNAVLPVHITYHPLALPIGISFYTFQILSYIIDVYRGNVKVQKNILNFALYVTMFPQLIAGPIVQYADVEEQLVNRKSSWNKFGEGCMYFIRGLAKKVLLANTSGMIFTEVTGLGKGRVSVLSAWLGAFAYMFQIYFDFSGYSDMAIGIGKMFRITIPENFRSPYKAESVKDFWKRWHITLSSFLQTYVYFPLGGSRKGKARTIVNTLITFLVSGLWHGANWTFVFWGLLHGIGVAFNSLELVKVRKKWLARAFTFAYICMAFVFFRADSLGDGFRIMGRIFSFQYNGSITALAAAMEPAEIYIVTKALSMIAPGLVSMVQLAVMLVIAVICVAVLAQKTTQQQVEREKITPAFTFAAAFLFVWSVLSLSGVSTFVYFNF